MERSLCTFGRRVLHMYQEWFPNRNHPHHTVLARLYQRLREDGFFFIPGALVEDRVKREHLRLKKKYLRELAMTPQLAHVPLSMPWVQISLQCSESCKNKTSMHTTFRNTRTGTQRLHTSCSICPVVFATKHHESCLSCTSLVYW